ncbi:MAG: GTP-binding protein, partial [Desulfobacterales bacterium]|nr:GTP-binding protein [Desulfobacterales bacterium]
MIKKKICMLGSFSVGKTSLVRRFVKSVFSEKYLSTVGVKIDKKTVEIHGREVDLMLWDIHGEDEFQRVRTSYLRGASGYFLVVDGSREDTLKTALGLKKRTEEAIGATPCILVFNKADIRSEWEIDDRTLADLATGEMDVVTTSAKTGEGV